MKICRGEPAALHALQYVDGTLPESDVQRFEEHYFDCSVCLASLRDIQAVGRELARQPVVPSRELRPKIRFARPAWVWTAGAAAALLLTSVFVYRTLAYRPGQPIASQSRSNSLRQAESAARPNRSSEAPGPLSQLADLTLPAYVAPNLRGGILDARYEAGMKDYAKGNCSGAIAALSQVPAENAEARAAEFYSGACQMHLGDLASASGLLRKVADAGDSPQQEAALYSLAQIALAGHDAVTAHTCLLRTISLRGDFEKRAREQDRRIAKLIGRDQAWKNPETK